MAEYRVTVLYDDNSPNRRTYQLSLDGRDMGEVGEQSMVSLKTDKGSHTLAIDFAGKLLTTRTINIQEGQYVIRVHLSHDRKGQLSIRVDASGGGGSGSSGPRSAAQQYYAQSGSANQPAQAPSAPPKKKSKAPAVIIILLLAAIAAGAWYLFLRPAGILSPGGVTLTEISSGQKGAVFASSQVEIQAAELAKDKRGKRAIVVTYQWTNNSGQTLHGAEDVEELVFQDGVELDRAEMGSGKYDFGIRNKSVRDGTSVTVQTAYVLQSDDGVVEFELSDGSGQTAGRAAANYRVSSENSGR